MNKREAELQKRIRDLEHELHLHRITGEAQGDLLKKIRPMAEAARAEGGMRALMDAVRDYTPDQGTWPDCLVRRANKLRDEFERLNAAR